MIQKLFPLFLLLLLCIEVEAIQPDKSYYRSITSVDPGWHQITIPADLFEKAQQDFRDLRIYHVKAQDTLEIPYLIKKEKGKHTQIKRNFKRLNESQNAEGSYFTFENSKQENLNEILLQFEEKNFDWRINLEGSTDNKEWFTILKKHRILSIKNQHTDYQFTNLRFPLSNYRFLRIQVINVSKCKLKSAETRELQAIEGQYYAYNEGVTFYAKNLKKEKQTLIDIRLTAPRPISHINLDLQSELDYYRHFRLQKVKDSVEFKGVWEYRTAAVYRGVLSSLEKSTFSFSPTITNHLQLVIDNQDNLPIEVKGVQLKSVASTIQADFPYEGDYVLTYGHPKARRPAYDIGQFKDQIPKKINTLALGVEEEGVWRGTSTVEVTPSRSFLDNTLYLWLLMGLIIVVMAWFTLKMIRGAAEEG